MLSSPHRTMVRDIPRPPNKEMLWRPRQNRPAGWRPPAEPGDLAIDFCDVGLRAHAASRVADVRGHWVVDARLRRLARRCSVVLRQRRFQGATQESPPRQVAAEPIQEFQFRITHENRHPTTARSASPAPRSFRRWHRFAEPVLPHALGGCVVRREQLCVLKLERTIAASVRASRGASPVLCCHGNDAVTASIPRRSRLARDGAAAHRTHC